MTKTKKSKRKYKKTSKRRNEGLAFSLLFFSISACILVFSYALFLESKKAEFTAPKKENISFSNELSKSEELPPKIPLISSLDVNQDNYYLSTQSTEDVFSSEELEEYCLEVGGETRVDSSNGNKIKCKLKGNTNLECDTDKLILGECEYGIAIKGMDPVTRKLGAQVMGFPKKPLNKNWNAILSDWEIDKENDMFYIFSFDAGENKWRMLPEPNSEDNSVLPLESFNENSGNGFIMFNKNPKTLVFDEDWTDESPDIELESGWNLISTNRSQRISSLEFFKSEYLDKISSIWIHDKDLNPINIYSNKKALEDKDLYPNQAFWVNVKEGNGFVIEGESELQEDENDDPSHSIGEDNEVLPPEATTDETNPVVFFDDFEGNIKSSLNLDSDLIEYTEGKNGLGFFDVYKDNPNGGKIRANVVRYDNTNQKYVNNLKGTVSFWVKAQSDPKTNEDSHGLFQAFEENYGWQIKTYKNMLYATRDFPECARNTAILSHNFKVNEWHEIKLSWNGQITKLYIDGRETGNFEIKEHEILKNHTVTPSIAIGDDLFVTDNFEIRSDSTITDEEAEEILTSDLTCSRLYEFTQNEPQETYKGIDLRNFSNPETREILKEYIDLMPDRMRNAINHIVIVDDDRYSNIYGSAGANFSFYERKMFLRKSLHDSPEQMRNFSASTIFHEAGHALIYDLGINYGGPNGEDKRKEWANISGIDAYSGECSWRTNNFGLGNGFLTAYGSSMPDEDLAVWVGKTYGLYLQGKTIHDFVGLTDDIFDEKYQGKLDFLRDKGFISQEIYDAVN